MNDYEKNRAIEQAKRIAERERIREIEQAKRIAERNKAMNRR